MKLIHETDYVCLHENEPSATKLYIYAVESEMEELDLMFTLDDLDKHDEVLADLGYQSDGYVPAGAPFSRYYISMNGPFVIVEEYSSYNI